MIDAIEGVCAEMNEYVNNYTRAGIDMVDVPIEQLIGWLDTLTCCLPQSEIEVKW